MDRRGFLLGTFAASFAPCWPVAPVSFTQWRGAELTGMAEVAAAWTGPGFIDFSIAENRRRFINAEARPVST